MSALARNSQGFVAGSMIGTLGGLIGLGGAEFRLPVLVGVFRFGSLEAVILNKAMSLVVVAAALLFRGGTIAPGTLANHLDVVLNLLAGSLVGAWWAAGHAITLPRQWLNRIILVLLVGLALVMLSEAWAGVHEGSTPLFEAGALLWMAGLIAGLGIGMVAALLGVAGGELLIPVIVLLYGLDIKLAGSLSLMVSLPTMIVGFARYSRADAFKVLREEKLLMRWMVAGSILGAVHEGSTPLFEAGALLWMAGLIAGLGIGMVAALLGVAGGELLIPVIVLLYGLDIKLAGSLSLMVSLPTMIVGFARYSRADAFKVLREEKLLMRWMVAGSILGAALGGLLLGLVPTGWLLGLLGVVLLVSAIKTFQHAH
jgi:uncharacterized membrane protein YfcA